MKSESAAKPSAVKRLGTLVILCLSTSRPKVKAHCPLQCVVRQAGTPVVTNGVSIRVCLYSVTVPSLGLAHIWSAVCSDHPHAGGHFTAGEVRTLFIYYLSYHYLCTLQRYKQKPSMMQCCRGWRCCPGSSVRNNVQLYICIYTFLLLNRLHQQVDASSFAACSGTQDQRGRLRTAQGTNVPM